MASLLLMCLVSGIFGNAVFADSVIPPLFSYALADTVKYGSQGTKPSNSTNKVIVEEGSSIQNAIDKAAANTTIIVRGKHSELLRIRKDNITIKGESAVLNGKGQVQEGDLIDITGSNIVIDGLELTGFYLEKPSSSESVGAIRINPNSHNVHIINCDIHDLGCKYNFNSISEAKKFNGHGISVKGKKDQPTTNITISNNKVHNLATGRSECVVLNGNVQYFTISDNYIYDNDNIAIDCAGGYKFEDENGNAEEYRKFDWSRNGEVTRNYVSRISSKIFKNAGYLKDDGTYGGGSDGIYVDGGRDIWIHENYVTGCDIGIEVASEIHGWTAEGVLVERNLVINNDQYAGFAIGGSNADSNGVATGNTIRYNTIINSGIQHCLIIKTAKDNHINNNIFIADKYINNELETFYSENDLSNNAFSGNIVKGLEKYFKDATKFTVNSVSVDASKRTVTINTSTDISAFGYSGTTKQDPTTKPGPTTKPNPTTKQDPTTKPGPTTKPNPTTKQDPTTKPEPTTKPNPTTRPTVTPTVPGTMNLVEEEPDEEPEEEFIPTTKPTATGTPVPQITNLSADRTKPTATPTAAVKPEKQIMEFVARIYIYVLDRELDSDGAEFWTDELYCFRKTGAEVAQGFIFSDEFVNRRTSDKEFVTILYKTFFGRDPEKDGMNFWLSELSSGSRDRVAVANGFIYSQEWADTCAQYGIRSGGSIKPTCVIKPTELTYSFVERIYTTAMCRGYDEKGKQYWAGELSNFNLTGEQVGASFFLSEEMEGYKLSDSEYINRLYATFMNRSADKDGADYWLGRIASGASRKDVVFGFTRSPEFVDKCIEARILPY